MADILIIDDDHLICDILSRMMDSIGHDSTSAQTGKEGLEKAKNGRYDIVFLDVNLPDASGLNLIRPIKKCSGSPEVIIITGENHPDGAALATSSGAWNYIEKPFLRQELNLQVSRALEFRKEKGDLSTPGILKRHRIVGETDLLRTCLDQVSIAAYTDDSVLISGEAGTGKRLFAKTIHLNSDRSVYSFVMVDCATLSASDEENLLFGHEIGAFSGAVQKKKGLIARAHNGTLFLNEISKLSIKAQGTLLNVIENLSFSPMGSDAEKISNFRIIATTQYDLDALVRQNKFRKDLLFKLRGGSIHLPPLRQIKHDLVKITLHYITKICRTLGKEVKGVSPEFLDIIKFCDWPGNVSQLISALETAVISARNEPTLYSVHLPVSVRKPAIINLLGSSGIQSQNVALHSIHPHGVLPDKKSGHSNKLNGNASDFVPLNDLLDQVQKDYLQRLMARVEGNLTAASKIAGLSRSTLSARLKKFELRQ